MKKLKSKSVTKRKSKYTPGDFELRVGKAATGKGLFTKTEIPKNSCIIEYIGAPVKEKDQHKIHSRYLFETEKNKMINGNIKENIARYINHSCKPNCEAQGPKGRVFIFSLRKIKAREELTYHYGKEYFDEYFSNGRCRCPKCADLSLAQQ